MDIDKILEKTALLFKQYGIRSVTMDDISRELAVSKKTLYNHVKDKKELVEKVVEKYSQSSHFEACVKREKFNAVEEFFMTYKFLKEMFLNHNPNVEYDLKKYYPDIFRKYTEVRNKKMYKSFSENLKKGKEEGYYRENLNVDILSWWHVKRTEFMQNHIQTASETENFGKLEILEEMINYHFQAIATEKGIIEFKKLIRNENKEI